MKLRMGMSRVGALTGAPVVRPCAMAQTLQPEAQHAPLPVKLVVLPDILTAVHGSRNLSFPLK